MDSIERLLKENFNIEIACYASHDQIVVSGRKEDIERFIKAFENS